MNTIEVFPNAKVNLGLNIKGKRADGYHILETIFLPAPLKDRLYIEENSSLISPEIVMKGIAIPGNGNDNLCVRAWKLLKQHTPALPAVHIVLEKNIPAGSGLGGGSSDAAFTLKALIEMFSIKISAKQLREISLQLGADVPFFLENKPVIAKGIGEILEPLDLELPGEIRIQTFPFFSDTRMAYAELDYEACHPNMDLSLCIESPCETWRNCIFNDFEPSVFRRFPELKYHKQMLYDAGAVYASMSGSGSALYGLFPAV